MSAAASPGERLAPRPTIPGFFGGNVTPHGPALKKRLSLRTGGRTRSGKRLLEQRYHEEKEEIL